MKKFVAILILTLLSAAAFSAFAAKPKQKTETVTYAVDMHCQNCVNKLTDKLSFLKGVEDMKISLKAHDVPLALAAYRLMSERVDYPLHLGITEAGPMDVGLIRSTAGLAPLLLEGIGDTIRISLSEEPEEEVKACHRLLHDLGLKQDSPTFISCPTCGRTCIDVEGIDPPEVSVRVIGLQGTLMEQGCLSPSGSFRMPTNLHHGLYLLHFQYRSAQRTYKVIVR